MWLPPTSSLLFLNHLQTDFTQTCLLPSLIWRQTTLAFSIFVCLHLQNALLEIILYELFLHALSKKQGFSNVALLTLWHGKFFGVGGSPVQCRMSNNILGQSAFPLVTAKHVSRCYQMSPGGGEVTACGWGLLGKGFSISPSVSLFLLAVSPSVCVCDIYILAY